VSKNTGPIKGIAAGFLIIVLGLMAYLVMRQSPASKVESQAAVVANAAPQSAPTVSSTLAVPASTPATAKQTWTIQDASKSGQFIPALDEIIWRATDGEEEVIAFLPVAGVEELRTRISQEQAARTGGAPLLIMYQEGLDRSLASRRIVTNQVLVRWTGGGEPQVEGAVSTTRPDFAPEYVIVEMPDSFAALDAQELLRGMPGVAEADVLLAKMRFKRALPNDPLINRQWHLKFANQSGAVAGTDMNIESAWGYGTASPILGAGVRIGIVDDGLETGHPDLAANVDTANDYDWNGNDNDPSPGPDDDHGTACAGNAAAVGNNGIGMTGSAPAAKLIGLRLIAASVTDAQEAAAMNYLINSTSGTNLLHIKSNSWGPSDTGTLLEEPGVLTRAALRNAATTGRGNLGSIILWAGGNGGSASGANADNSNYDGYANSIYTIAVGAFDSQSRRSNYSERGANLVVVAPSSGASPALGVGTVDRSGSVGYNSGSTGGEISDANYTVNFGGTSSSTPSTAGVAALLLQRNPNLGWRDMQEIFIRSAKRVNPNESEWATNSAGLRFNHNYGAGLVDATAAVALAATWTNLSTQLSQNATQSGLSVAIPENTATGITRTFNLTGPDLRVEHVTVKVDISHASRGNLDITLTSPSGMVSRLAEVHTDSNDNYTNWTFMTVRNWGESSTGPWTLKVADVSASGNLNGGTLNSAELTVFGSASAPTNPPPVVQLTSPTDGAAFSPAVPITVAATATDLTVNGAVGTVARVDFLSGQTVVGSDTTAPYSIQWTPPANGSYALSARATDSENAVGTSSTVNITVANRAPVINAASITPQSPAFSDQSLTVGGLSASDPEGSVVSFAYQWQSSSDGQAFSNAAGATSSTLPASAGNIGKLWRCQITPSDGTQSGTAFTTEPVLVVGRPAASVTTGQPYSYTAALPLRGTEANFTRQAIINEFSQGPSGGTSEWVEILTLKAGSLRGWQLLDSGTSPLTFSNTTAWDNIPAGTCIVIYNGSSKDPVLPANDVNPNDDGRMVIASNNTTYFTGSWSSLANSGGDALRILNNTGATVHQISYGNNSAYPPNVGSVGSATAAYFAGDSEALAVESSGWGRVSSTTVGSETTPGVTPGAGNPNPNFTFVTNLRSGFFNQAPRYRFGASSQTPQGLTIQESTGVVSGIVSAPAGTYQIVIERFNGLSEVITFSFTLQVNPVGPPTFSNWITGFGSLSDQTRRGDSDGDGIANLVEYLLGKNPSLGDGVGALSLESTADTLSLSYRKSKSVTAVTDRVVWSTNLIDWSVVGVTYASDVDLGSELQRKASVPINGRPRLYLRLEVTE
jgi:subtilisin family serine protease